MDKEKNSKLSNLYGRSTVWTRNIGLACAGRAIFDIYPQISLPVRDLVVSGLITATFGEVYRRVHVKTNSKS